MSCERPLHDVGIAVAAPGEGERLRTGRESDEYAGGKDGFEHSIQRFAVDEANRERETDALSKAKQSREVRR